MFDDIIGEEFFCRLCSFFAFHHQHRGFQASGQFVEIIEWTLTLDSMEPICAIAAVDIGLDHFGSGSVIETDHGLQNIPFCRPVIIDGELITLMGQQMHLFSVFSPQGTIKAFFVHNGMERDNRSIFAALSLFAQCDALGDCQTFGLQFFGKIIKRIRDIHGNAFQFAECVAPAL